MRLKQKCKSQINKEIMYSSNNLHQKEIIDSSKDFYERETNISYSSEFQVKKKIMYFSNDFQKKVIIRTENFYQRNDNSIESFVSFETLDASNVIIDEWKTFMLNSATIFQSTDETIATKAYSRIWNKVNIDDDSQV